MPDLLRRSGLDRARTLEEACAIVSALRGRPLEVVDADLGPGVSGLWLGYPDGDRVVVNPGAVLSALHRRHVIAHELVHVAQAALGDGTTGTAEGVPHAARAAYDDPAEAHVEELASRLMVALERGRHPVDRLAATERFA